MVVYNIITVLNNSELGGHVTCSIHEVEAGDSQGPGQPGLHRQTLSQQDKTRVVAVLPAW